MVDVGSDSLDLDNVLRLLSASGDGSDGSGHEAVLVIATDARACQEAVLKLTESGFNRLQAIYPRRQMPGNASEKEPGN